MFQLTTISGRCTRAASTITRGAVNVYARLHQQLLRGINLRSRRGEGNAIWTILVIGLIAVVAAVALFPIGSKVIQMGQDASSKLQSPPW